MRWRQRSCAIEIPASAGGWWSAAIRSISRVKAATVVSMSEVGAVSISFGIFEWLGMTEWFDGAEL
jgi:hypothetical protein